MVEEIDNRDMSFLPIAIHSPKYLTIQDIEKYNSKGFVAPFNAFSKDETITVREKVDNLFAKLQSYEDGRDSYSINCYQHKSKTVWDIVNTEKILNYIEDLIGSNIGTFLSNI